MNHALESLGKRVEEKTISNVDRWSIHHDLFALCVSNQISFKNYLDFVRHYENEDDYVVLSDIISSLNFFYILLSKEEVWQGIKEFNLDFFNKIFARLGWDTIKGEKPTTALLRGQIISSLGRLEDEKIISEAKSRFSSLLKTGQLNPESTWSNLFHNSMEWRCLYISENTWIIS